MSLYKHYNQQYDLYSPTSPNLYSPTLPIYTALPYPIS